MTPDNLVKDTSPKEFSVCKMAIAANAESAVADIEHCESILLIKEALALA